VYNFSISAVASNSGKTILTTALLYHFRDSVRPFKIGPDFIDPQFHKVVCGQDSINLDSFLMNEKQVEWLYANYSDQRVSIVEGVMGFYDGDDKGCSAYSISKLLQIPTILLLDASGSYITVSALLHGLLQYRKDNTIKAVVLNHISSAMHFNLIKDILQRDHEGIVILGWIKKDISALGDTHLGLDLKDLDKIEQVSKAVVENIDLSLLQNEIFQREYIPTPSYPFDAIERIDQKLAIVRDQNFSFLYYDNLQFLQEVFREVLLVDATKDEVIPKDCDSVYICGGYVESDDAYARIENSQTFKKSLIEHSQSKNIYAECAGLLYLSNRVDDKKMSGILDVDFTLQERFQRLGYYYNEAHIKGHSFHYTKPIEEKNSFDILSKRDGDDGKAGSWERNYGKIFGTYLHIMFRNNLNYIKQSLDNQKSSTS